MASAACRAVFFAAAAPASCVLALKTSVSRHDGSVGRVVEDGVPEANQINTVRRTPPESASRVLDAGTMPNCDVVSKQLRKRNDTSIAASFWDIACNDRYECGTRLPDMTNGCVYISTNARLQSMLESIGRPNPCSFREVFTNSFFLQGECPSERKDGAKEVTSHGGVTYGSCDGGLVAVDSTCSKASPLEGITNLRVDEAGFVNILVMDAVIGLPDPWEKAMGKRKLGRVQDRNGMVTGKVSAAEGKVPDIKIEFYACAARDELLPASELEQRCKDQVSAVQAAHRGEAPCEGTVYDLPKVITGLTFSDFDAATDLHYIEDDKCGNCDYAYDRIWDTYMPEEQGKAKVLLCNAWSILGISAFPGDAPRGTMVNFKTMPGGSLSKYNQGKTVVHELGHYFGLYHTFQDQCSPGDKIEDTDAEANPYFGCPNPADPPKTCEGDNIDPVHNFMDYEDDRCMCGFTNEQKLEMVTSVRKYIHRES